MYIAGSENVVADALSRIYANDSPGTVRARSKHTYHDVVDDDMVVKYNEELPLLAGIEAQVATRRGTRDRRPSQKVLDASTTIAPENIVPRKQCRLALRGPRPPVETTEGGSTDTVTATNTTATVDTDGLADTDVPAPAPIVPVEGTLLNIVSQSLEGLDLLSELRGKYELDPVFQPIIAKPKDFRNFEVDGQLIYLKASEKRVLCIPKVVIQGRSA